MSRRSDVHEMLGKAAEGVSYTTLFILSMILRGVVIHLMWIWFVTPVFEVPAPGIALCIGLGMLAGYLAARLPHRDDTAEEAKLAFSQWRKLFNATFFQAFTLGIAWVVHLFV